MPLQKAVAVSHQHDELRSSAARRERHRRRAGASSGPLNIAFGTAGLRLGDRLEPIPGSPQSSRILWPPVAA